MDGKFNYVDKQFTISKMTEINEKIGGAIEKGIHTMQIIVVIEKVDKIGGDPFYEKYMKYKLKYLQLKGNN